MTSIPQPTAGQKKLGLVIDLDTCVGCHACAVNCKEWNTSGHFAPLTDFDPYQEHPQGVWLNRVHSYEAGTGPDSRTVHFPRSCLHCEEPACVTVCPTGASYKRAEDGIVLVNTEICIGCKLCSWACPYGAREFDEDQGVMKKCTLCIDRIYNENIPRPNAYPPASPPARPCTAFRRSRRSRQRGVATGRRARRLRSDAGDGLQAGEQIPAAAPPSAGGRTGAGTEAEPSGTGVLRWIDRVLSR